MNPILEFDSDTLTSWIGRSEARVDVVSAAIVDRMRATLSENPFPQAKEGECAPLCVHWCLFTPNTPMGGLGPDGHPARGGLLPPITLERRMWTSGRIELLEPLRVGDRVSRESKIADVVFKEGSSGPLCFVTLEHRVSTDRETAILERQVIAYLSSQSPPTTAAKGQRFEPPVSRTHAVEVDPVRLFRYSALTFNAHRIHYDRDYATTKEGYRALVVHGPLQATWLLHFAESIKERPPSSFSYRGYEPLLDTDTAHMVAGPQSSTLRVAVLNQHDHITMSGLAQW